MNKEITELLNSSAYNGTFSQNEPMAPRTTFKVGGKAAVFAEPDDSSSLIALIKCAVSSGTKYFILGGGSNIVFPDGMYDGIVISTAKFNGIELKDCSLHTDGIPQTDTSTPGGGGDLTGTVLEADTVFVKCGSGVTVNSLVNFCSDNNLWNAEQFAGLPGTAGGAVYMNARCFNKSISDIFVSAEYLDLADFSIKTQYFDQKDWDYKKSPFQNSKKVILSAVFRLTKANAADNTAEQLKAECKKYINERIEKGHFKYPSAGSVFKNNHAFGKPSGAIIDEAGLKGLFEGGAQVASFHGNFIINNGNATAENILTLVQKVQRIVQEKTGFLLEPEIIFLH